MNARRLPGVGTLALAVALAGCTGGEPGGLPGTHEPLRQTTSIADQVTNAENVKVLCDFFYVRPHEVLLTSGGEGNATMLASAQGIRPDLKRAVDGYYAGEVTLESLDGRRILDERYKRVIEKCQESKWTP